MGLISGKVIAEIITSMVKNINNSSGPKSDKSRLSKLKTGIYYINTIIFIFGAIMFFSLYDYTQIAHSVDEMKSTIQTYRNIVNRSHSNSVMFDNIKSIYVIQTTTSSIPNKQLLTLQLKTSTLIDIHEKVDVINNHKVLILHVNEKYP